MSAIQKLIDVWESRPPRVEPDNESDLVYIFARLLPALVDAMPEIEATRQAQIQALSLNTPSMVLAVEPPPAGSSHNPTPSHYTGDNVSLSGPEAGTAGTPASADATPPGKLDSLKTAATKHGRRGAPRRRTAVLPGQQQETQGTEHS